MQVRKWGCAVGSPGRQQPPHPGDGLGCVNLGLKVNYFSVSVFSEFSDFVVRNRNLASYKIHQNALVQAQTAEIKGRALTISLHLPVRTESKTPGLGLSWVTTSTGPSKWCSVLANHQTSFLILQLWGLISCSFSMCCSSNLGKKSSILHLDSTQVLSFLSLFSISASFAHLLADSG